MISPEHLPAAVDTERLILGAVLVDESSYDACADILTPEDFSLDANRRVYAGIKALRERGDPIDRMTIYNELQRSGDIESVGGLTYLISLDDNMPRIANLEPWARTVRDKAVLRRTAYACQSIMGRITAAGSEPPAELLEAAEGMLGGLKDRLSTDSEFRTPREVITDCGGLENYFQRRQAPGVESPWPKLNAYTHGLQPGELCIVAAATSGGKTTFALNWALRAARNGVPVAFFSMEMERREVTDRLLSIAGGFDSRILWRRPVESERVSISAAARELTRLPIHIRDKSICTVSGISAAVRRLKTKADIGLVIVDYLQLMTSAGRSENRTQEVSGFSRGLKRAAQDLGVPLVALSQLSRRPGQEKRKPELSDLRESGTIEQDANIVLFLAGEHDYQATPNQFLPIELILAKQRKGPARIIIPLLFRADCGRFESRTEDGDE